MIRCEAKRRTTDGKWDYIAEDHLRAYPIGYCQPWSDIESSKEDIIQSSADLWDLLEENKDKFHSSGHETAEQACECYFKYILDISLVLDNTMPDMKKRCEVCEEWTQGLAILKELDQEIILCDKHRTRHVVKELVGEINVIELREFS